MNIFRDISKFDVFTNLLYFTIFHIICNMFNIVLLYWTIMLLYFTYIVEYHVMCPFGV